MFNLKKKDAVADAVAMILAQEAELSDKQKKIAKIAGDKEKIDAADLAALRAGKKPVEEGFDDMEKYLKDKNKPQPSGGAGKKQGSKYGGSKQKEEPNDDEDKMKKEEADVGYARKSGTKAGHALYSKKLSNEPQTSKSDVTLQSGATANSGKSYNFPKGTKFVSLPGGIFGQHPDVPETHPKFGHLIKSNDDNIKKIHKSLKEENEMKEDVDSVDETYTAREIKMATGIAKDKRYAGGNMTGAAKVMDKIKPGLSQTTAAQKSLRQANEDTEQVDEKAPPGFEGTVKAMKKHKDIDNPFALAWSMKNKGYKSHKKADGSMKKEEVEELDEKEGRGSSDPLENRADYAKKHGTGQVYKKTHAGDKTGMTQAYAYDIKRSGPKGKLPEEVELDEAVSRKHFQQVADLIKTHDNPGKRKELAQHHAEIFKQQNPRFDHAKFMKAAGVNEEVGHVEEKVDPSVRTKETLTGSKPTKQKDDVGPGADGKSTKVKFSAESWLKQLKKK